MSWKGILCNDERSGFFPVKACCWTQPLVRYGVLDPYVLVSYVLNQGTYRRFILYLHYIPIHSVQHYWMIKSMFYTIQYFFRFLYPMSCHNFLHFPISFPFGDRALIAYIGHIYKISTLFFLLQTIPGYIRDTLLKDVSKW